MAVKGIGLYTAAARIMKWHINIIGMAKVFQSKALNWLMVVQVHLYRFSINATFFSSETVVVSAYIVGWCGKIRTLITLP